MPENVNSSTGQLAIHDQMQVFVETVATNEFVTAIVERASELALPGWCLTAGCLFQTIWNVQHDFDPTRGIRDYDLFYFDDSDTSWEAEDAVERESARLFRDLPVKIEVRNQARVHLWYHEKFGIPCDAFRNCEDGIDSFLSTSCCLGMRRVEGDVTVYAPHGFADVFNLVVRPNLVRAASGDTLREVYETKARRWLQMWPRLTVIPWPAGISADA